MANYSVMGQIQAMLHRLRRVAIRGIAVFALISFPLMPASAGQDDPALAGLFKLLRTSTEGIQAQILQNQIWVIWHQHDDPDVSRLMDRGIRAMHEADYPVALAAFDAVTELDDQFAEGWNKRATLYYLMGDYDRSVLDIQKTLELEPRHFGALSGLGLINMALDRKDAAIAAFEQTIAVNPHATGARQNIEMLREAQKRERI